MTVGGANTNTTFSGTIAGGSGLSGGMQAIALVKSGTGDLTLTGSNSYVGGSTTIAPAG